MALFPDPDGPRTWADEMLERITGWLVESQERLRDECMRSYDLEVKLRAREAEILRIRTHETQAAHQLDGSLTPEHRADFTRMANRIAELEAEVVRLRGDVPNG